MTYAQAKRLTEADGHHDQRPDAAEPPALSHEGAHSSLNSGSGSAGRKAAEEIRVANLTKRRNDHNMRVKESDTVRVTAGSHELDSYVPRMQRIPVETTIRQSAEQRHIASTDKSRTPPPPQKPPPKPRGTVARMTLTASKKADYQVQYEAYNKRVREAHDEGFTTIDQHEEWINQCDTVHSTKGQNIQKETVTGHAAEERHTSTTGTSNYDWDYDKRSG